MTEEEEWRSEINMPPPPKVVARLGRIFNLMGKMRLSGKLKLSKLCELAVHNLREATDLCTRVLDRGEKTEVCIGEVRVKKVVGVKVGEEQCESQSFIKRGGEVCAVLQRVKGVANKAKLTLYFYCVGQDGGVFMGEKENCSVLGMLSLRWQRTTKLQSWIRWRRCRTGQVSVTCTNRKPWDQRT